MSAASAPSNESVLVTGAAGFVGGWLCRELRERGLRVVGTRLPGQCAIDEARAPDAWVDVDLTDPDATQAVLAQVAPRHVVHLAAIAVPREAAREPFTALATNYWATVDLARAIERVAPSARLLFVSSSEVYGRRAPDAPPAREADPPRPPNVYAATKLAAERALAIRAAAGRDVVIARPFNHSGPGRPASYAESSFASQIAAMCGGGDGPSDASPRRELRVGNLEAMRDFSDVRDVVAAYATLLERGRSGEVYNVCSGRPRSIRSIVDSLIALSGADVELVVDPDRYEPAPADALVTYGDPAKLRSLGWAPRYPFDATLADLLGDWRQRLAHQTSPD